MPVGGAMAVAGHASFVDAEINVAIMDAQTVRRMMFPAVTGD